MTDYKNELIQILDRVFTAGRLAGKEAVPADVWDREIGMNLEAIEALLSQHSKKRELEALQSLRDKRTIVEMDLDMEWPYWCENCTMCLEQEDDMCACIALTKDRIKQLGGQDETNKGE